MKEIYHLDANILQIRPDLYSDNLWIIKGELSRQKLLSFKIPDGDICEFNKITNVPVGMMLKAVISGVLIFSELKDPAMSDSNRIYCVDTASGDVIYDEQGWYFDRVIDKSNFALRKPLNDSISSKTMTLEDLPDMKSFSSVLIYPNIVHASSEVYMEILVLLKSVFENIIGAIEILENRNLLMASFHIKIGEKMVKLIALIDEEGKLLKKFEIASHLDKYIEESFFVWGNFMIFVQEKKKLRFLTLDTILV